MHDGGRRSSCSRRPAPHVEILCRDFCGPGEQFCASKASDATDGRIIDFSTVRVVLLRVQHSSKGRDSMIAGLYGVGVMLDEVHYNLGCPY